MFFLTKNGMVLDLTPASIEHLLELQAYILKWGYRFVPLNHMECQVYFIYCSVMCVCVFCLFYNEMLPRKWFALYFNAEGNPNICSSIFPRV